MSTVCRERTRHLSRQLLTQASPDSTVIIIRMRRLHAQQPHPALMICAQLKICAMRGTTLTPPMQYLPRKAPPIISMSIACMTMQKAVHDRHPALMLFTLLKTRMMYLPTHPPLCALGTMGHITLCVWMLYAQLHQQSLSSYPTLPLYLRIALRQALW